jgi:hypothetical protein
MRKPPQKRATRREEISLIDFRESGESVRMSESKSGWRRAPWKPGGLHRN